MDAPDPSGKMAVYLDPFQGVFARIEALPQVVIAEINGAALGGGFELALACDLRYAAEEAKLGLPEATLGLIPGAGGTQRLTRICGRGVAGRIIYGAEPVDGKTACDLGMVQWVCPRAELEEKARVLADRISELPAGALRAAKHCIHAFEDPKVDGFKLEIDYSAKLIATADAKRQMDAFLAKSKK
jgi:enoyl-CoA hydratase/carnithine racemase